MMIKRTRMCWKVLKNVIKNCIIWWICVGFVIAPLPYMEDVIKGKTKRTFINEDDSYNPDIKGQGGDEKVVNNERDDIKRSSSTMFLRSSDPEIAPNYELHLENKVNHVDIRNRLSPFQVSDHLLLKTSLQKRNLHLKNKHRQKIRMNRLSRSKANSKRNKRGKANMLHQHIHFQLPFPSQESNNNINKRSSQKPQNKSLNPVRHQHSKDNNNTRRRRGIEKTENIKRRKYISKRENIRRTGNKRNEIKRRNGRTIAKIQMNRRRRQSNNYETKKVSIKADENEYPGYWETMYEKSLNRIVTDQGMYEHDINSEFEKRQTKMEIDSNLDPKRGDSEQNPSLSKVPSVLLYRFLK